MGVWAARPCELDRTDRTNRTDLANITDRMQHCNCTNRAVAKKKAGRPWRELSCLEGFLGRGENEPQAVDSLGTFLEAQGGCDFLGAAGGGGIATQAHL